MSDENYSPEDLVQAIIAQREMFANETAKQIAINATLKRRIQELEQGASPEDQD